MNASPFELSPIAACLQIAHRRGLAIVVERLAELGRREIERREAAQPAAEPQRDVPPDVGCETRRARRKRRRLHEH